MSSPSEPDERGRRDERAPPSTDAPWQQRAAFSVFVDTVIAADGREHRQTRLYHEESGDETTLVGFDQTALLRWIVHRISNGAPAGRPQRPPDEATPGAEPAVTHRMQIDVLPARVLERVDGRSGADAQDVRVEVRLRITGLPSLVSALGHAIVASLIADLGT